MTQEIELIYDRLVADEKLKAGTKYERLAAIAFRILTDRTTIHDLRLCGQVGVPHQIDVVVGDDQRRILIEAKDYDSTVDLPVVRDFSAVVEDLRPDEAFVVTTVGFSRNARKWAAAKGLTLALLRSPGDDDWGDLVKRVEFHLRMSVPHEPRVDWAVHASEASRFSDGRNPLGLRAIDDLALADDAGQLSPFRALLQPQLDAQYRNVVPGTEATLQGVHQFSDPTWLHLSGESPIRVNGYTWTQEVGVAEHDFSTGFGVGGLAAELVLRTIDGSIHRIFSNKEIQSWVFDGDEVLPAI